MTQLFAAPMNDDTPPRTAPSVIRQLAQHPLRDELYGELHARPTPLLDTPLRASHIVLTADPDEMAASRAHLAKLAKRFGNAAPAPEGNSYDSDFGGFKIRWEQHTEFCSLTVVRAGAGDNPFAETAMDLLPDDWVDAIPGQLVAAAHVAIVKGRAPDPTSEAFRTWFEDQIVVGSRITSGKASVWTTFRMHSDGFSRFLVHDNGLSPFQAGRTLQRLLEVETYRVMSLLALPVARRLGAELTALDEELAAITDRFQDAASAGEEQKLLADLSSVAAKVEHYRSTTNYRFGATRAYYELVQSNLANLREDHHPGMSSMTKFIERRLGPGVRTSLVMEGRLEGLSQRVGRAGELLQARINVSIETQNQDLLVAMNRRSQLQLRLQQTVEGLSVAAISYYTIALLKLLFESLVGAGLPLNPIVATGISMPIVIGTVWWLVRRIRKHLIDDKRTE